MSNNLIGATLATFTVTLSSAVTEPVDVAWSTRDGTAKAGTDYKAANGVVTFLPGETVKQVQVTVYGQEDLTTPDKNFFIELSPPSNAVLGVTLVEVVITIDEGNGVAVLSLVVPQGKRGLKGDPGLSAYEQAVFMGQFTGTLEEWMENEASAARAAERAQSFAADAAGSAETASAVVGQAVSQATQQAQTSANSAASSAIIAGQKAVEAEEAASMVGYLADGKWFFKTEALLLANKPQYNTAAKALDTKKVWFWETNDGGVTGVWTDTGLSELDQAINYTNQTALSKEQFNQKIYTDVKIHQFDNFSAFSVGFVDKNGRMPFGIMKSGIVAIGPSVITSADIKILNAEEVNMPSFNMRTLSPFTGYAWGLVGKNGKMPIAVDLSGTVRMGNVVADSITVLSADEPQHKYEKASQEWWIHPVHTYTEKPYPRVVSGAYGEDGSIIVGEYVIGQGITKSIIVGQTALIDDHNAPSVFIKENRRSVVMWQNHDKTQYLSAKVSTKDGDISTLEFAAEQQIATGVNISYTQLHHIESESTETEDIFYIFSRFAQTAWGFTKISVNQETGVITTLDQHNILTADAQYYITSTLADNKLRIASYYNPDQALNSIHYWEIDIVSGDLTDHLGTTIANVKTHANLPINIANIAPVLAHNASIDRRMFYVRPLPMSPAILYLEWTAGQLQNTGNYKVISLESDGSWKIRTYAASGKPFYSNYFDGASFPDPCMKDEILVCRYDNENNQGVLERVINNNETMIAIESARVETEHLIRPMSPKNGGNLCAYVQLHAYATTSTFSFESDVKFKFLK